MWREGTAIACPGAHPLGLALAARRRGFAVEVWILGPRPWIREHVRSAHAFLPTTDYAEIERSLERACRRAGVPVRRDPKGPAPPGAGLLLVTDHRGPGTEPDPHWIGLVPDPPDGWVVHDPMRPRSQASDRTFDEWWAHSGFGGARSWVQVVPAAPSGPQHGELRTAAPSGPAPHPPSPHAHAHDPLARRAWTRAEALAVLESPDRRKTQDPLRVWRHARLRAGETVVEVGAGTGYFAVPAARRVGGSGRVYAVDLSEDLVALLGERRDRERLPQLHPVRSSVDRIPLPTGVADVVLLANVLHDIPSTTLTEAVRLLRPGGRFLNVDWKKIRTPGGPPREIRLTPAGAERLLAPHGLRLVERWELGPWHYGLTLARPLPAPTARGNAR